MKVFNFFLTIVITVFILVSCSKDDSSSSSFTKESQDSNVIQKSNIDFSNFGISHNLAMDFVGKAPRFEDMSKHEIYVYIHGYSDQNMSYDIADTNWVEFQERLVFGIELANDFRSAANLLLNNEVITLEQFGLVDSLFMVLEEAADFDNETYLSIEDFNEKVRVLEDHIYKNYTVKYDDITTEGNFAAGMLATCSIMKYSYMYWCEAVMDPNHLWHNNRTTDIRLDEYGHLQRGLFGSIWHGIKVGAVDTGVFLYSIFTRCKRDRPSGSSGLFGSLSCACSEAGAASSGV